MKRRCILYGKGAENNVVQGREEVRKGRERVKRGVS
jgi:hypothetical protein